MYDQGIYTAEEWTNLVGRGLWHVRETTFQLFCFLEEEIRTYLNALMLPNAVGHHLQFVDKLIKSEDIQFYWCIAVADFDVDDTEVHGHLLKCLLSFS